MQTPRSVVLNLFAEERQIQPPYDFVTELKTKNLILTQVNWHICFIAELIMLQKLLEVLLKRQLRAAQRVLGSPQNRGCETLV